MKPLIGVTADIDDGSRFKKRLKGKRIVHLWERYLIAVSDAGGTPVLLPVGRDREDLRVLLSRLDGILISGGAFDVPPDFYGERLLREAGVKPKQERSRFERELVLAAGKRGLPILGICGGEQIINVAFGGSLFQDIGQQYPSGLEHEQKIPPIQVSHSVVVLPGTLLSRSLFLKPIATAKTIRVNSTHHQAVKKLGAGRRVAARAPDGLIEAVESKRGFILGVQWHPELLYPKHPEHARLWKEFIKAAIRSSCEAGR